MLLLHFSYFDVFYYLYFQLFYMLALILSLVSNKTFYVLLIYNYYKTVMYKIFILIADIIIFYLNYTI